jgi:hypothetical protein
MRPTVIPGLAKLVELVNQYAAPMLVRSGRAVTAPAAVGAQ